MTGFEPATTRPPDAYSNRAELHPECECKGSAFFESASILRNFIYANFVISCKPVGYMTVFVTIRTG